MKDAAAGSVPPCFFTPGGYVIPPVGALLFAVSYKFSVFATSKSGQFDGVTFCGWISLLIWPLTGRRCAVHRRCSKKAMRRFALLFLLLTPAALAAEADALRGQDSYQRQVLPLLEQHRYDCHSDGVKKGRFTMDEHAITRRCART